MDLFRSHLTAGLLALKNTGNGTNYEDFCQEIIDSITEGIYTEEWISYWDYWKKRFMDYSIKNQRKERDEIFEECLRDCRNKGFLQKKQLGLTANISSIISGILEEKTPTN